MDCYIAKNYVEIINTYSKYNYIEIYAIYMDSIVILISMHINYFLHTYKMYYFLTKSPSSQQIFYHSHNVDQWNTNKTLIMNMHLLVMNKHLQYILYNTIFSRNVGCIPIHSIRHDQEL